MKKNKKVTFGEGSSIMKERKSINLQCKCGNWVEKVDPSKTEVICWQCVIKSLPQEELKLPKTKTGFPPGWKIYPVFVHTNSDVYHKGKIQKKLKGTLAPTKVKTTKRRTKREIQEERNKKLVAKYNRKKKLKKKKNRK